MPGAGMLGIGLALLAQSRNCQGLKDLVQNIGFHKLKGASSSTPASASNGMGACMLGEKGSRAPHHLSLPILHVVGIRGVDLEELLQRFVHGVGEARFHDLLVADFNLGEVCGGCSCHEHALDEDLHNVPLHDRLLFGVELQDGLLESTQGHAHGSLLLRLREGVPGPLVLVLDRGLVSQESPQGISGYEEDVGSAASR